MVTMKSEYSVSIFSTERCRLGEGLFVDSGIVAWVDIDSNTLLARRNGEERKYNTDHTATVVLAREGSNLLLGTEIGIESFDLRTGEANTQDAFPGNFDSTVYRSNDGCCLPDGGVLLGFMRRKWPSDGTGGIFFFRANGPAELLNLDIAIPNSFIPMQDGTVLVSDSLKRTVYRISFDETGGGFSHEVWGDFENIRGEPDGGCLLPDGSVLLAMWADSSICRFWSDGVLLNRIQLPVIHPTNCKLGPTGRSVIVTSARVDNNSVDDDGIAAGQTFEVSDFWSKEGS